MGKQEYNFVAQCVTDALNDIRQTRLDKHAVIMELAIETLKKERQARRIPRKLAKSEWKASLREQGIFKYKPKRIN